MKIAVLHHNSSKQNSSQFIANNLIDAGTQEDQIDLINMRELVVKMFSNKAVVTHPTFGDLADYDVVYLRSNHNAHIIRGVVAQYLQSKSVPMSDPGVLEYQKYDKASQNIAFLNAGINVANSVFTNLQNINEELIDSLGYPVIVKGILSSKGDDNVLLHSYEEVREFISNPETPYQYIFQSFVPNSFDYRFIIYGGVVASVYTRERDQKSTTHLNNKAKGGSVTQLEEWPQDLEELALSAAQAVGRANAGVDIMKNDATGEHLVLEVNFISDIFHTDASAAEVTRLYEYLRELAN